MLKQRWHFSHTMKRILCVKVIIIIDSYSIVHVRKKVLTYNEYIANVVYTKTDRHKLIEYSVLTDRQA